MTTSTWKILKKQPASDFSLTWFDFLLTCKIWLIANFADCIHVSGSHFSIGREYWSAWLYHDAIIKWKQFPQYWPFVQGIHWSPVNSPHKGQWCWALMFSFICAGINGWVNNREADDLRRHHAHYDVTVMTPQIILCFLFTLTEPLSLTISHLKFTSDIKVLWFLKFCLPVYWILLIQSSIQLGCFEHKQNSIWTNTQNFTMYNTQLQLQ